MGETVKKVHIAFHELHRILTCFDSGHEVSRVMMMEAVETTRNLLTSLKTLFAHRYLKTWQGDLKEGLINLAVHFIKLVILSARRRRIAEKIATQATSDLALLCDVLGGECDILVQVVVQAATVSTDNIKFISQASVFGSIVREVLTHYQEGTGHEAVWQCVLLGKLWVRLCGKEDRASARQKVCALLPTIMHCRGPDGVTNIATKSLLKTNLGHLAKVVHNQDNQEEHHSEASPPKRQVGKRTLSCLISLHQALRSTLQQLKDILDTRVTPDPSSPQHSKMPTISPQVYVEMPTCSRLLPTETKTKSQPSASKEAASINTSDLLTDEETPSSNLQAPSNEKASSSSVSQTKEGESSSRSESSSNKQESLSSSSESSSNEEESSRSHKHLANEEASSSILEPTSNAKSCFSSLESLPNEEACSSSPEPLASEEASFSSPELSTNEGKPSLSLTPKKLMETPSKPSVLPPTRQRGGRARKGDPGHMEEKENNKPNTQGVSPQPTTGSQRTRVKRVGSRLFPGSSLGHSGPNPDERAQKCTITTRRRYQCGDAAASQASRVVVRDMMGKEHRCCVTLLTARHLNLGAALASANVPVPTTATSPSSSLTSVSSHSSSLTISSNISSVSSSLTSNSYISSSLSAVSYVSSDSPPDPSAPVPSFPDPLVLHHRSSSSSPPTVYSSYRPTSSPPLMDSSPQIPTFTPTFPPPAVSLDTASNTPARSAIPPPTASSASASNTPAKSTFSPPAARKKRSNSIETPRNKLRCRRSNSCN